MTDGLAVIADVPRIDPQLGFQEYANALADAIRGGRPPQFTIGLYGTWGSGKTSLLHAVFEKLSEDDSSVIPVMFDAWRYEKTDHIVVPLLHKIHNKVEKSGDKNIAESLKKALKSLVYSLKFKLPSTGLELNAKDIGEFWDTQGLVPLDKAFSEPFEALRTLPKLLKNRRIAVLIDDLDRCSPEKVVSVLESINLVMDVPGFIFVLALDYEVLVNAVTTRYPHVSGDVFIQKMIQLPFRVPPLNVESPNFLYDLIPELTQMGSDFPDDFAENVREISILGLKANPRQIKRLVNSFLLLKRIIQDRKLSLDHTMLAALIGLQLRWPSHYQDIQDSVFSDDSDPFQTLLDDKDEPDMEKYSRRFFKSGINTLQIKQMLQLTMAVAIEESAGNSSMLKETRESMLHSFIQELENKGYEVSSRSSRLYYHPHVPSMRFVIGKAVIRLEEKNRASRGRPWQLVNSFSIRWKTKNALDAADKLIGNK